MLSMKMEAGEAKLGKSVLSYLAMSKACDRQLSRLR